VEKKNKETLLLFNTSTQLVLLDMKGRLVKNYPVKLKFPATAPVRAIDYDGKGEPRFLFTCDDHKLYNYSLNGKPTSGWVPPSIGAYVKTGVEYIKLFNKDYLIVTDANGLCHFYDRKGRGAFNPSLTEFIRSSGAPFKVYPDGKLSRIITTDRKGRIIRIAADGNWESITLKSFSPDHFFMYDDFDGDEFKDYIYTDSNTLTVYNVNKKIIFELEFPAPVQSGLIKVESTLPGHFYGVVSEETRQLFLFNHQGWSPMNKFLTGSLPFCTGVVDQSGYTSLITADGKIVYNYYLTEPGAVPF
jgi:hypothetical protein